MSRKSLSVFALILVLAMVLSACAQPIPVAPSASAPAEGEGEAAAPAEEAAAGEAQRGGVWSRLTSSDISGSLTPLLSDNTAASDVGNLLYDIGLIGQDPVSGELGCEYDALCESMDVSDDGLVYTYTLRQGLQWSDGEEINAEDFLFTYNAINSDLVETARKYVWDGIASIEAPDPYTVVVTYNELKCSALSNIGLAVVPAHTYAADFSDVMTNAENEAPTVVSGPFNFQSHTVDDNAIIVRSEAYRNGAPNMDGMIYRVVPDAGSRLAQLQNGETDVLRVQANQLSAVEGDPNITVYEWNDDGFVYMSMNLANPDNPQPGMDENGEVIPQDPHPILGDKLVRQAISQAIDYDSVIEDIYFGKGYRMTANVLPAIEWAYNNDLEPWQYDPEAAMALLEEAGWVDSDGDGVREKDGEPMALSLETNAGNTVRETLGAYIQDALGEIGIQVDFQAVDFGTLLEHNDNQTFDMIILGWTGTGSDPDDTGLFGVDQDIPGSGFNSTSFYNAEYERLADEGNAVAGCAPEDRAEYYKQIQEIFHDEAPYVFITGNVGLLGYRDNWEGLDPQPWAASEPIYWNTHEWYSRTAE